MSINYKVSFKREINHNYLIIDSPEGTSGSYECKMLSGNLIEGLLKFRVRHHEDKKEFYYEITSKQPLARILEQRKITSVEIKTLLLSISGTISRLEEFLLKEEGLLLDPEYIYIDPDYYSIFFCMVPGLVCDFPSALTGLLEYLLGKVNHQDKDGVVLAYNLYHESLKENYGMQDLLRFLSDKENGIFLAKEASTSQKQDFYEERINGWSDSIQSDISPKSDNSRCADNNCKPVIDNNEKNDSTFAKTEEQVNKIENRNSVKPSLASGFLETVFRIILLTAVGEAVLWFLTGEAGLYRYGTWILAGGVVLGLLTSIIRKNILKNLNGKNCRKIEYNKGKSSHDGQESKNVFKEEPDKYWTDCKESDNMEESKEVETDLLADFEHPSSLAILESLSRERNSVEIPYLPFVLGKHAELADYCLNQPTVSRLHLRIDRKESVYIVTDLNSTNGTIVEGYHLQANETVSIKNGDIIYLADVGFRFLETVK